MTEWTRPKIGEVFDFPLGGIFAALQSLDVPWKDESIALQLDWAYYGRSAEKYISPLISGVITTDKLSSQERAKLAGIIYTLYNPYWEKQYASLSFEYNPINNYDMMEVMTNDTTEIEYGKKTTRTDDLTQETTPDLTNTETLSNYGYNSTTGQPKDVRTATATGTNTNTSSGTQDYEDSGTDTHTRNYTLTRSGNIGVTTSQQMIESERKLWLWNFFEQVVFPDVDRVLTIQIY